MWEYSLILNAYIERFLFLSFSLSLSVSEWQSLELPDCGGNSDIHCSTCFEKTLCWGHTQESELIPFTDVKTHTTHITTDLLIF